MDKTGPRHRTCRRVGAPLCGRPNCPANKRPYPPGQHGRGRKRISEYQTRLLEKQKLRAMYVINEKQMRAYYERATRSQGVTGEEMIRQLETRLDTVILRLGFALTMRQARQLVSHGHVRVEFTNTTDELELRVADDGIGLAPEFSIDATRSLGLSIVRDLVRSQLGGRIEMTTPGRPKRSSPRGINASYRRRSNSVLAVYRRRSGSITCVTSSCRSPA